MSNFEIHSINNLMPAEIKFEEDGQIRNVIGYINYKTQELFCVTTPTFTPLTEYPGLAEHVSEYLRNFIQDQNLKLDRQTPVEIHEKMQKGSSYKVEDYIPSDLTVELVKAKDGKSKH